MAALALTGCRSSGTYHPKHLDEESAARFIEQNVLLSVGQQEQSWFFSTYGKPVDGCGGDPGALEARALGWVEIQCLNGKQTVALSAEGRRLAPSWRSSSLPGSPDTLLHHFTIGKPELDRVLGIDFRGPSAATVRYEWHLALNDLGRALQRNGKNVGRVHAVDLEMERQPFGWAVARPTGYPSMK